MFGVFYYAEQCNLKKNDTKTMSSFKYGEVFVLDNGGKKERRWNYLVCIFFSLLFNCQFFSWLKIVLDLENYELFLSIKLKILSCEKNYFLLFISQIFDQFDNMILSCEKIHQDDNMSFFKYFFFEISWVVMQYLINLKIFWTMQ